MATSLKLSGDDEGKDIYPSLYRSMICSLLHLNVSLLDIAFSVEVYARHRAKPKESYLAVVKRVIRYVKSTSNFGLLYTLDSNSHLVG